MGFNEIETVVLGLTLTCFLFFISFSDYEDHIHYFLYLAVIIFTIASFLHRRVGQRIWNERFLFKGGKGVFFGKIH